MAWVKAHPLKNQETVRFCTPPPNSLEFVAFWHYYSGFGLIQRETTLHCNDVFHWLRPYTWCPLLLDHIHNKQYNANIFATSGFIRQGGKHVKAYKNRRLHSEIELLPICNAIASHEAGIEASAHLCVRVHLFICWSIYEIEIAWNFLITCNGDRFFLISIAKLQNNLHVDVAIVVKQELFFFGGIPLYKCAFLTIISFESY